MERYKDQNYAKLRKHHQELGVPWTDPLFSPNNSSIGLKKVSELRGLEWTRVGDICSEPRLVKDGVGRHDVIQGKLGNCWFVAAASVLAGVEKLWERVLPDLEEQDWDPENKDKYSGVFRFRFWRFGGWIEVLVDDYLPTRDGVPVFTYSRDKGEYWGALLEKAYAKLHGSYECLDGGNLSDALVDFTGGVAELIQLHSDTGDQLVKDDESKTELFVKLNKEIGEHALICCAIRAGGGAREERTEMGLIKGHAYGVTALKKVPIGSSGLSSLFKGREKIPLVRLRNPWGEKEWNGAFSDRSPEWKMITEKEREKLGLVTEDDGEFWMPWDDFVSEFTDLSINHLINTSLFSFSKTWKEFTKVGDWNKPRRAGGCINHPETFLLNPQFRFDINTKDGEEEEEIILQLSQKDDGATFIDREKLVIGIHLLKVESNRRFRVHDKLKNGDIGSSDYIRSRHVFYRTRLKAGRYIVVPTTFNPGDTGQFLLRLFGDDVSGLVELDGDEPPDPPCLFCGCQAKPQIVTRLTIESLEGLPKKSIGGCDPYLIVRCEGETVKSPVIKDSVSPTFHFSTLFYRKLTQKPIKVQVWEKGLLMDSFLGESRVEDGDGSKDGVKENTDNPFGEEETTRTVRVVQLYNRGRKKEETMPGTMKLIIESRRDLSAF